MPFTLYTHSGTGLTHLHEPNPLTDELQTNMGRIEPICSVSHTNTFSRYRIQHRGDIQYIHSVILPSEYSPNINDYISIEIGGFIVWHMPIILLEGMFGATEVPYSNPPEKRIRLPPTLFPIISLCLPYHHIEIHFSCNSPSQANLMLGELYISNSDTRRNLAVNQPQFPRVASSTCQVHTGGTNQINVNGPTTGIFIDISRAPSYRNSRFIVNGNSQPPMDPRMMEMLPHSNTLMFYSLTGRRDPLDTLNPLTYENAFNMSRIDSLLLNHNTENPEDVVVCYLMTVNTMRYMSGMGGLIRSEGWDLGQPSQRPAPPPQSIRPIPPQSQRPMSIFVTNRKIPENEDITCSITLNDIMDGERYSQCSQCHKNFKYEDILHWLNIRNRCPTCRSTGTFIESYINQEQD